MQNSSSNLQLLVDRAKQIPGKRFKDRTLHIADTQEEPNILILDEGHIYIGEFDSEGQREGKGALLFSGG